MEEHQIKISLQINPVIGERTQIILEECFPKIQKK
jgi:hypothetical protein